jgi:hypothetical protein
LTWLDGDKITGLRSINRNWNSWELRQEWSRGYPEDGIEATITVQN